MRYLLIGYINRTLYINYIDCLLAIPYVLAHKMQKTTHGLADSAGCIILV